MSHFIAMYGPQIFLSKCHIYKLVYVHIWYNYVSINTLYEAIVINYETRSTAMLKYLGLLTFLP